MASRIQDAQQFLRTPTLDRRSMLRRRGRSRPQWSDVVSIFSISPTSRKTVPDYSERRTARAIYIALGLILALGSSFANVPAQAQSEIVLVSNWSQLVDATSMVDDERLQPFTTGSHADGYVLTRIELDFVLRTTTDSFTVNLWTASGNRPGNRIAVLKTSAVEVGEPTVFTSSTPVVLQPDRQYFLHLVVKNPNDVLILRATKSGAEDKTRESTSWQIADDSVHIASFGSSTWITEESVMKLRIFGYGRGVVQARSR